MPLDDTVHAVLMGLCPGTLTVPAKRVYHIVETGDVIEERPICDVCNHEAGVTPAGLVGQHVQEDEGEEPSPLRSIYLDRTLTVVEAANTVTPGVLIGRRPGDGDNGWRLIHAPQAVCLHMPHMSFDRPTAEALAAAVYYFGDWLQVGPHRKDHAIRTAADLTCFVRWHGLNPAKEQDYKLVVYL